MYCPNCGTRNEKGAEQCQKCAGVLPQLSPEGEVIMPAGPASIPPSSGERPAAAYPAQPGQPGSQYSYSYPQPAPNYNPYQGAYAAPVLYQPDWQLRTGAIIPAYAGFWPRLGAWIIDSLLTGILAGVLIIGPLIFWLAGFITRHEAELAGVCDWTRYNYDGNRCSKAITDLLESPNTAIRAEIVTLSLILLGASVLAFVLVTLYLTLLTARGATLGKKAFGLKVVTGPAGKPPGFGRALLRMTIGYWISSFLYLGFIWIAFDPYRQGWHDKLAGTYVIKA